MKILITGGLGYLGCELASIMSSNESIEKITIFDKGIFGFSHCAKILNNKTDVVIGDILDRRDLSEVVRGADIIIHLASLVGAPLVDRKPYESQSVNIEGSKLLSSLVRPDQKLVFASTGSCYGKVDGICTENTPISPLSSYGLHKAEGEKIFEANGALNLRFATVFGLSYRTRNDLYINNMVKKAVYDRSVVLYQGDAKRTFIHITDVARAIEFLALKSDLQHKTYNVGNAEMAFSKREICELISQIMPFQIVEDQFAIDPDQRDYVVSYERLYNEGYTPIIEMKDQLQMLKNYYQAQFKGGYENG